MADNRNSNKPYQNIETNFFSGNLLSYWFIFIYHMPEKEEYSEGSYSYSSYSYSDYSYSD